MRIGSVLAMAGLAMPAASAAALADAPERTRRRVIGIEESSLMLRGIHEVATGPLERTITCARTPATQKNRPPVGGRKVAAHSIKWRMSFSENRIPLFRDMR